jgi:hypothetical protein
MPHLDGFGTRAGGPIPYHQGAIRATVDVGDIPSLRPIRHVSSWFYESSSQQHPSRRRLQGQAADDVNVSHFASFAYK